MSKWERIRERISSGSERRVGDVAGDGGEMAGVGIVEAVEDENSIGGGVE